MAGLFDVNLAGLGDLLKGGGDFAVKIRQAITGQDPEGDLKKLQLEIDTLRASDAGQVAVNTEEAKSSSLFVSGWRPAVGWVCAVGAFWVIFGHPLATWACALWAKDIVIPAVNGETVMSLLFGMLGLSASRTVEKIRGVAAK